jgi:sialate O-acetylesterase
VGGFSAAGDSFAARSIRSVKVPVGLINNAWGGSAAEAWVRRDVLEKDERFKGLMENTVKREADLPKSAAKTKFEADTAATQKRAAEAKAAGKPFFERAPGNPMAWANRQRTARSLQRRAAPHDWIRHQGRYLVSGRNECGSRLRVWVLFAHD